MSVAPLVDKTERRPGLAAVEELVPVPSSRAEQGGTRGLPGGGRLRVPLPLEPLPARPLVSVVIANYNYAAYVGQAIESALDQDHDRLEVVVVDDGSTDDSRRVIAGYAERDPRVRLVCRENGGMAAAWNTGFDACRGDIVCLLDADDTFLPGKVAAVVRRFAERPRTGLVVHALVVTDREGREVQRIPVMTKVEEGWIADRVARRGGRWRSAPTSGISFRRSVGEVLFPISETAFRWGADGFIVTLSPLLTEVGVAPDVLSRYRVHGQNDLGSFGFDRAVARRVVDLVSTTTAEVNGRLHELGLHDYRLDATHNLGAEEYRLLFASLDGEPRRALLRRYRRFVRLLAANDLYGRSQQVIKGGFLGIAVALPMPVRTWWLAQVLGHSRTKYAAQRLLPLLRRGR